MKSKLHKSKTLIFFPRKVKRLNGCKRKKIKAQLFKTRKLKKVSFSPFLVSSVFRHILLLFFLFLDSLNNKRLKRKRIEGKKNKKKKKKKGCPWSLICLTKKKVTRKSVKATFYKRNEMKMFSKNGMEGGVKLNSTCS